MVPETERRTPRHTRADAGGGRSGRLAVLIAAVLAAVFVLGAFAVPWLEARGVSAAKPFRLLYAPLCHQLDSRCLKVDARAVAVCARCAGLYLGGLAGLLLAAGAIVGRGREPRPIWLAIAFAPTLVDAGLPWVGLSGLGNGPRLLLALPAGLMAGVFLAIGIHDLFNSRKSIRSRRPGGPRTVVEGWDG